jgi:hypothetical protein
MHRGMSLALVAASIWGLGTPSSASAVDDSFASDYISLGGGVSVVTARVSRFLPSRSEQGASLGADVRLNPLPWLLLDLDYGADRATFGDLDLTRQQADVALGFLGSIGRYSSWYVEAVYGHVQFQTSSPSLCGGDCLTEQHDGVGVKGGFIWPFAYHWYTSLSAGYISMGAHNGFDGLAESLINASIGYRLNSDFSVGVRTEYMAYVERNDTGLEQDFASWRAFVSYHF